MAIPREGCVWTERRVDEYEAFEQLLKECRGINNATGIIERLQRIEQLAEKLDSFRLGDGGSFRNFLSRLCLDDRFPGWENAPMQDDDAA